MKAQKEKKLAPTPMLPPGTYTATEVLRWVKRQIKAEPKRLDMGNWLTMFKGEPRSFVYQVRRRPECGTVACLAGWINIGTGQVSSINDPVWGGTALRALFPHNKDGWIVNVQKRRVASELDLLFYKVKLKAPDVIKELERYIRKNKPVLDQCPVVVPEKEEEVS